MSRFVAVALPLFTCATVVLSLLGTHAVESFLIQRLSAPYVSPAPEEIADIDVVVVLTGGFVDTPGGPLSVEDGREPAGEPGGDMVERVVDRSSQTDRLSEFIRTYDQPDSWSTARLIQGVRTYFESGARTLVITGYWVGENPARLGHSMKAIAVALGAAPDAVVVEPKARTTREHPVELARLGVVRPEDTLGIVTSSWHLRRAMGEFAKQFPNRLVAVPAHDTAVDQKHGLLRWLPRSRSLASSATALAEYIGMVWYRL